GLDGLRGQARDLLGFIEVRGDGITGSLGWGGAAARAAATSLLPSLHAARRARVFLPHDILQVHTGRLPGPSIGPSEPACPSRRFPWGSPPGFGCSTRHRGTPGGHGASQCPPHTTDRCPLGGPSPILRSSIFPGDGREWSEESPAQTGCFRPPSPRDAPTATAGRSSNEALCPAPRTCRRSAPRRRRPACSSLRRLSQR